MSRRAGPPPPRLARVASTALSDGLTVRLDMPVMTARALVFVLQHGAASLRARDALPRMLWIEQLVDALRRADQDAVRAAGFPGAASPGAPCSDRRTTLAGEGSGRAASAHEREHSRAGERPEQRPDQLLDVVTVEEARRLTGWSTGYLCRLGRDGLGSKRAGVWFLDRAGLLAAAERAGRGGPAAVRGARDEGAPRAADRTT